MSKSGCTTRAVTGKGNPATPAGPAARNSVHCHGTGETVPFMNRTFEWGVGIATFLSLLSIVPRHCARLTYFLHSKLRKVNAVLIIPQLITLPLPRLRCAGSIPPGGWNAVSVAVLAVAKRLAGNGADILKRLDRARQSPPKRGRRGATPPPSSAGPPSAHTPPRTRAQGAWPCPGYRRAGGCPRART